MDKKKIQLLLDERMNNFNLKIDNSDFYNKINLTIIRLGLFSYFYKKFQKKLILEQKKTTSKKLMIYVKICLKGCSLRLLVSPV
jgi:hypothetical protein